MLPHSSTCDGRRCARCERSTVCLCSFHSKLGPKCGVILCCAPSCTVFVSGRFLHKEREVSVCLPVSRVTLEATRKLATDKAGAALSLSLLGSATLSSSPGAPSTILLPLGRVQHWREEERRPFLDCWQPCTSSLHPLNTALSLVL